MIRPGDLFDLDVSKAAAGGRMLARHGGQVVLAWGAIPGERVRARVERVTKGVVFAETVDVLSPSPDRRLVDHDWRCGGNVLAHVAYARQLQLKAEIVYDAFVRIARFPLASPPPVLGSPEQGYRMRARLHADGSRLGFFREGSHVLCDAATTGQLLPSTNGWIAQTRETLARAGLRGLAGVEIAENVEGDERACHFELHAGVDAQAFAPLAAGLVGASARAADAPAVTRLAGSPVVTDHVQLAEGGPVLRLARDARAFFQGNRYLLERFVRHVVERVPRGPAVDLYAGVGLFGLALAATRGDPVVLVEGDPVSGADLQANAASYAVARVERASVEDYLGRASRGLQPAASTFVVDPPRTGLSREALGAIVRTAPGRIVYVSCDVATLARDTRALLDGGFELQDLTCLDLFPSTAHIETVAVFVR